MSVSGICPMSHAKNVERRAILSPTALTTPIKSPGRIRLQKMVSLQLRYLVTRNFIGVDSVVVVLAGGQLATLPLPTGRKSVLLQILLVPNSRMKTVA